MAAPAAATMRPCRRSTTLATCRRDQVTTDEIESLRRRVARLAPGAPLAESRHRPLELIGGDGGAAVEALRGRTVAAFCGVGNPEAFRRTLAGVGATVAAFRAYPDH